MSEQGHEAEAKPKKKRPAHIHIGPNRRAFKSGKAFCPVCDAERIIRFHDKAAEGDTSARGSKKR